VEAAEARCKDNPEYELHVEKRKKTVDRWRGWVEFLEEAVGTDVSQQP
jgi:hypothetical protein